MMAHTKDTAKAWYEQETQSEYKAFLESTIKELKDGSFEPYEKFTEGSVVVYSLATRNAVRQLAVEGNKVVGVQVVSITHKPFNMLKSINDVMVFPRGQGYGAILSRAGKQLLQGWSNKTELPIIHEAIDNNAAKIRALMEKAEHDEAIVQLLSQERKRWKKLTPRSSLNFYPDEEPTNVSVDFSIGEVLSLMESTAKRLGN